MIPRLEHRPLRIQIAVALAMAMGLVFLVNTLLISALLGNQLRDHTGRHLAGLAEDMATRLDLGMHERWADIAMLVRLEEAIADQSSQRGRRAAMLSQLKSSTPDFTWIGFATPEGVVAQATDGMLEGKSVALRPWFSEGAKRQWAGDLHEALLLQQLLGSGSAEPLRFVDIAAPIHGPDGTLAYVVGAHLSWQWAEDLLENVLATSDYADSLQIFIVDQQGKVILGPNLGQELAGFPQDIAEMQADGAAQKMRLNGREMMVGYAATEGHGDYPGLGWIVVAAQSMRDTDAPMHRLLIGVVGVGVVTILGGLAFGVFLAWRVSEPLRRLTAEAQKIGLSPDAVTLPRLTGAQEVVQLSQALRSLLRRLGVYARGEKAAAARAHSLQEENAILMERATRDPLTGLFNRRAFLDRAAIEVAASRRFGHALGVIMLDIDHFKRINDNMGHATGDVAIKGLAQIAIANSRQTDAVARFGGEEFVILLPHSDRAAVDHFARKLRSLIELANFEHEGHRFRLTSSIGCAMLEAGDASIETTIDRADRGLYEAKKSGRNRVCWG